MFSIFGESDAQDLGLQKRVDILEQNYQNMQDELVQVKSFVRMKAMVKSSFLFQKFSWNVFSFEDEFRRKTVSRRETQALDDSNAQVNFFLQTSSNYLFWDFNFF